MANQPIISPAIDEVVIPVPIPVDIGPLFARQPIIAPIASGTGGTTGKPIIG
jgi:hypothetical protein